MSMRESYSDLVSTKQWPALTETIPSGNLGYAQAKPPSIGEKQKNPNGMKCHIYVSEYPFKSTCPNAPPSDVDGGKKHNGSTQGNSD